MDEVQKGGKKFYSLNKKKCPCTCTIKVKFYLLWKTYSVYFCEATSS